MDNETSQSAETFIDLLIGTFELYQKDLVAVVFLTYDNTEVNPSIARKMQSHSLDACLID